MLSQVRPPAPRCDDQHSFFLTTPKKTRYSQTSRNTESARGPLSGVSATAYPSIAEADPRPLNRLLSSVRPDCVQDMVIPDTQSSPTRPSESALSDAEFSRLFTAAHPGLLRAARRRLKTEAAAEDAVQEAAIVALSIRGKFRRGSNFNAWMRSIVLNIAKNHARAAARRHAHEKASPVNDHANQARPITHAPLPQDRVDKMLESLQPIARQCFLLKVVLNRDYQQISAALGIPPATARSHVFRARQSMMEACADFQTSTTERSSLGRPS